VLPGRGDADLWNEIANLRLQQAPAFSAG